VKQLNQLRNEMRSLKSKPRKMIARTSGIESREVPMEIAYTVKQITNQRNHVETAREYIGNFVINQNSPIGQLTIFPLNPVLLTNTRLSRLASNFAKFRFRRLALTVQSSSTTAVNGLFIVGYNSNPDAEILPGQEVACVMNLPGAISTNVWRTITSVGKIIDGNKWYNVDLDSSEIMNTTQGYFAIVLQSVPNLAANTSLVMPVMLDYTIEFSGSAVNRLALANNILVFPASTWVVASGNFSNPTALGGEPSVPALVSGKPYLIIPEYPVVSTSGEQSATVMVLVQGSGTLFYINLEAFQQGTPMVGLSYPFNTNRTTLTPLN
jgi:hypothetical protein